MRDWGIFTKEVFMLWNYFIKLYISLFLDIFLRFIYDYIMGEVLPLRNFDVVNRLSVFVNSSCQLRSCILIVNGFYCNQIPKTVSNNILF